MSQTGFSYELQIHDLTPGDTGTYACCFEDAASAASLAVIGRMDTCHHLILSSCLELLHLHLTLLIKMQLFLFTSQLRLSFSPKSWKTLMLTRATV